MNIAYILLAILGLGFLIFIHELGHYFVAKKAGMKIKVFSIGFGKPIFSFKTKEGIQWQIGMFPFGGFVDIEGMEKKNKEDDPYKIKNGYFSKKPISRIAVAFAGPISNLTFAFVAFFIIWISGGRLKPFMEYTKKIGYINPTYELFQKDVRPGDEIEKYDSKKYNGIKDLLYSSLLRTKKYEIKGNRIDYYREIEKNPFNYLLEAQKISTPLDINMYSIGIESAAHYLFYNKLTSEKLNPQLKSLEMEDKDRLIWVNGSLIFSVKQLRDELNENIAFLTVKKNEIFFQARVPIYRIEDLPISKTYGDELDDYRYENKEKLLLGELYMVPYVINKQGKIKEIITEKNMEDLRNPYSKKLEIGDQIVAINGKKVFSAKEIMKELQEKNVQIIVERGENQVIENWKQSDEKFDKMFKNNELTNLVKFIGTDNFVSKSGNLYLIKPCKLEQYDGRYGIVFEDKKIRYNPNPFNLLSDAFINTFRTLGALLKGRLNPKTLVGPIGVVQVINYGWQLGPFEALFLLGFVSFNLGIINLLPIPGLDGSHAVMSFWEMITKKRINFKIVGKIFSISMILIFSMIIFFTYNDIARIIKQIFT